MKTKKVVVEFELLDACEYKINKWINEFLRISYREFAPSYNIIDYKVEDEYNCIGCRNNNLKQRKSI